MKEQELALCSRACLFPSSTEKLTQLCVSSTAKRESGSIPIPETQREQHGCQQQGA